MFVEAAATWMETIAQSGSKIGASFSPDSRGAALAELAGAFADNAGRGALAVESARGFVAERAPTAGTAVALVAGGGELNTALVADSGAPSDGFANCVVANEAIAGVIV